MSDQDQSELCETGVVTDYCWNCIHLGEDQDGLAYCRNNPQQIRTYRHYPSTILPITQESDSASPC